jgi:hypothetical protein
VRVRLGGEWASIIVIADEHIQSVPTFVWAPFDLIYLPSAGELSDALLQVKGLSETPSSLRELAFSHNPIRQIVGSTFLL